MGDLLRNVTIIADFTRNGTILFSTPTFALYVGVLTAQKPNAYAVSLNARCKYFHVFLTFQRLFLFLRLRWLC